MGIAERMGGYLMEIPVKAAVKIEAGELVAVGADGYAVTATKAAGLKIAGCSATLADNRTAEGSSKAGKIIGVEADGVVVEIM